MAFLRNCEQEHSYCNVIHCPTWEGPGLKRPHEVGAGAVLLLPTLDSVQGSSPIHPSTSPNSCKFRSIHKSWIEELMDVLSDEDNVVSSSTKELSYLLQNWGKKWGGEDKNMYSPRASKNSSSELSTESLRTFYMCRWVPPNRHGPAGNTRRLTLTRGNAHLCSREKPQPNTSMKHPCTCLRRMVIVHTLISTVSQPELSGGQKKYFHLAKVIKTSSC